MPPVTVYGLALSSAWPVLTPSWGATFKADEAAWAPKTVYGIYFDGSGSAIGVSTGLPTGRRGQAEEAVAA